MTNLIHTIKPLGDAAITVSFGDDISVDTHRKVHAFCHYLDHHPVPALIEYVPAFNSVTLHYDVVEANRLDERDSGSPYERFGRMIARLLEEMDSSVELKSEIVEIPVCYGGEFGPDLEYVAEYNGLSPQEVIAIHTEGQYLVYMLGFAPGFPYLGGMPERIATPRRQTPRLSIPPGTVGIAGHQTGIYPLETPGGWQLIGRTPIALFRPDQWPPTTIQMGNIVKFNAITREEFDRLAKEERS